jgi:predicted dehydrogenase
VTGTRGDASVDPFRPRLRGLDADSGRPLQLSYGASGDQRMISAFLDTVRSRRLAEPGLDVALRTLSVVLAAAESAATGRTIRVQPLDA